MQEIYGWVKNLTYYFIFITVVNHVLPHQKYEKYIKLFSGLILILLVVQPITKGLDLEDQISYYFEAITYKSEMNDFGKELLGVEQQRLQKMIGQYENAVAMDLEKMIEESGFYAKKTTVTIEQDQAKETFGTVIRISMVVSSNPQESQDISGVSPVVIDIGEDKEKNRQEIYQEEQTSLNVLRRKVESYYGLEASYVEIRLENE